MHHTGLHDRLGRRKVAASDKGGSTARAALVFVASALATLVAGAVIEPSSEDIRLTMPASTKLGDYQLAISDICGGNAFLPGLFLVATTISGKPVMPATRDKRHLSATRTSDHPVSLKAQT